MTFYVGQKVVCVNDDEPKNLWGRWELVPKRGLIYTVSAVGLHHPLDPEKLPCIHVAEIDRQLHAPIWEHRFRPLVEKQTDISIFTEMLTREGVEA